MYKFPVVGPVGSEESVSMSNITSNFVLLIPCNLCYSYRAFCVTHTVHSVLLIPCILCYSYRAFCVTHTVHFVLLIPCISLHSLY